jgi:hypothetical protein
VDNYYICTMKIKGIIQRIFNPLIARRQFACPNCGRIYQFFLSKNHVHKCSCGVVFLHLPFPWSQIREKDINKVERLKKCH